MFFTYLRRELRRRMRQAIFISLGLALGIGLVITVTAASSGVKAAQGTVLQNLYGVGTSATVTSAPAAGSFAPGRPQLHLQAGRDDQARPADRDAQPRQLGRLDGDHDLEAERRGGRGRRADRRATWTPRSRSPTSPPAAGAAGAAASAVRRWRRRPRRRRRRSFRGPGSFNAGNTVTVDGVDLSASGQALGPLSNGTLSSGRTLKASDASSDVAVVDASYAKSASLKVGSDVTIASTKFPVVGIVTDPASDASADVYIPLARAQALASPPMTGKVNTIYVAADSSADIAAVQKEIQQAVPGATVTTSADLASEVTGSLASASSLANNLGKWLAIAVLVAAFLLASLLTMAAVSRRVREFGTLKALGWRSRRVIGQVMGESITMGIIGGVVGVGARLRRRRDRGARWPSR